MKFLELRHGDSTFRISLELEDYRVVIQNQNGTPIAYLSAETAPDEDGEPTENFEFVIDLANPENQLHDAEGTLRVFVAAE